MTMEQRIAYTTANAVDAHRQAAEAYRHMRLARASGNHTMYRFWALRGKQMFVHYENYRDNVSRLKAL